MSFKRLNILFILFLFLLAQLSAQTGGIKGKITSGGNPVPGVNVLLLNTTIGGVSDNEGNYIIRAIPVGEISIRYSAVGYETIFRNVEIVLK